MGKGRPDHRTELSRRLGRTLRRLRESRGMSQRQLAARAQLAPSALSRYEAGRHRIRSDTLGRLLTALGYDFGDLGREMGELTFSDLTTPDHRPPPPRGDQQVVIDALAIRVDQLREDAAALRRQTDLLRREKEALRRERDALLKERTRLTSTGAPSVACRRRGKA